MAMLKNVYDKNVPTRNLVTTISGIVTLVISILVGFGVLTPEQSTELTTQAGVLIQAVSAVILAITAIIQIFKAKDA